MTWCIHLSCSAIFVMGYLLCAGLLLGAWCYCSWPCQPDYSRSIQFIASLIIWLVAFALSVVAAVVVFLISASFGAGLASVVR